MGKKAKDGLGRLFVAFSSGIATLLFFSQTYAPPKDSVARPQISQAHGRIRRLWSVAVVFVSSFSPRHLHLTCGNLPQGGAMWQLHLPTQGLLARLPCYFRFDVLILVVSRHFHTALPRERKERQRAKKTNQAKWSFFFNGASTRVREACASVRRILRSSLFLSISRSLLLVLPPSLPLSFPHTPQN